jgi:hydrogenase maturation protease
MNDPWEPLNGITPRQVMVGDMAVIRGSRVRLMPRAGRDVFDLALAGRVATVESIELDIDGSTHLVVTIDDDPARDFRDLRMPGHRFFFRTDEVEPVVDGEPVAEPGPRVLIAGIGNVFLGDDGFGVEVAQRLMTGPARLRADVVDYGIRGMDLAYALGRYDVAILIDAAQRGEVPGTVVALDAGQLDVLPTIDTHGMDPVKVLALAQSLGPMPNKVLVVVCEPAVIGDLDDVTVGLSPVVAGAVDTAARLVESLLEDFCTEVHS